MKNIHNKEQVITLLCDAIPLPLWTWLDKRPAFFGTKTNINIICHLLTRTKLGYYRTWCVHVCYRYNKRIIIHCLLFFIFYILNWLLRQTIVKNETGQSEPMRLININSRWHDITTWPKIRHRFVLQLKCASKNFPNGMWLLNLVIL